MQNFLAQKVDKGENLNQKKKKSGVIIHEKNMI